MCGRYSLISDKKNLEKRFGVTFPADLKPRYNAAPTQLLPIIANDNTTEAHYCKWGLVPHWSLNEAGGSNLINIRSENILSKNTFKLVAQSQRCIVPTDGFYEWKKELKLRTPYRIMLSNEQPFAFAGIWDEWQNDQGQSLRTFGIVTTEALGDLKEIHDRMPIILTPETEKIWLHATLADTDMRQIFDTTPFSQLTFYKSHRNVNSAMVDEPVCIEPAPKLYPGESYSLFD
jgi:putative SOS response-associated peptidase YedK